ncbi:MAG: ABC transporter permease [Vulcanimicrobiaceae bacterium]
MRLAKQSPTLLTVAALLSLAVVVGCWQFSSLPRYVLPRPSEVLDVFVNQPQLLLKATGTTVVEAAIGFVISLIAGILLGVASVTSRLFNRTIYPLLVASQAVPTLALAPLIVVWFGFGLTSKVIVTALITFFPIVVATAVGLRSLRPDAMALARSIGLSRVQTFMKLQLPAGLPSIFGGIKVASTLVVVGAVVGEFIGSSSGLGYLDLRATGNIDTPLVFAVLIMMVFVGFLFYSIASVAESMAVPWRRRSAK